MSNIVDIKFNDYEIKSLIKKAGKRGIEVATVALWRVTRNSIRKRSAAKKTDYDLKVFFPEAGKAIKDSRSLPVDAYLSDSRRSQEEIVIRDSKRDTRTPQTKYTWKEYKTSVAGDVPMSHPSKNGIEKNNYWLRKSIMFDKKTGQVFLNPMYGGWRAGMDKPLPQTIEFGGRTTSYVRTFLGYAVTKKYYKNGKIKVSYSKIYDKKQKVYSAKERPFMKRASIQARPFVLKCLRNEIAKNLQRNSKK
jgi:hypothetical protein